MGELARHFTAGHSRRLAGRRGFQVFLARGCPRLQVGSSKWQCRQEKVSHSRYVNCYTRARLRACVHAPWTNQITIYNPPIGTPERSSRLIGQNAISSIAACNTFTQYRVKDCILGYFTFPNPSLATALFLNLRASSCQFSYTVCILR